VAKSAAATTKSRNYFFFFATFFFFAAFFFLAIIIHLLSVKKGFRTIFFYTTLNLNQQISAITWSVIQIYRQIS